jgi:DNA-binding CsgD family transcriptional regulator
VTARLGLDEQRGEDRALRRVLGELQQLEREIVELEYVRHSDALEQVRDAVRRLGEVGSPEGILERAASELGSSSEFDRVLISEIAEGVFVPRSAWSRGEVTDDLDRARVSLEYPLIEHEVARRGGIEIVHVRGAGSRTPRELARLLGWEAYVVSAITIDGATVGLLHADAHVSARALDEVDREVVARYSEGLAGVFERAVLRATLGRHRGELQAAVRWMSGRLEDDSGVLGAGASSTNGAGDLADALTRRELEVLRLMARGHTNAAIADALVVREGTVKYHVKNILRKLGATSRADAVARYLRGPR